MTVFKGFLIIAKRNIGMVFLYLAIFLTISLVIDTMLGPEDTGMFEQESINIAVVNHDDGPLADALITYLGNYHNIKDMPDDKSILQDRLFYREISYIVTIPERFEDKCLNGSEKLAVTKVPGAANGYYIDQQINTFMNQVRVLVCGGFSIKDAADKAAEYASNVSDITLLKENGHTEEAPGHSFMFQYMPYILLSILCYTLSYIMIEFDKPDVKKRMLCSAVSGNAMNLQIILGYALIGLVLWLICLAMPAAIYGRSFLTDPNLKYYVINSFIMTLVSLSMAFLISGFVKKEEIVSAVVNVITLGMSFSCGVFVSMDVLGKGLKTVAHFLPVYWYEAINNQLARSNIFSAAQLADIYKSFGIQLLFAAAFLGAALVFRRNQARNEA